MLYTKCIHISQFRTALLLLSPSIINGSTGSLDITYGPDKTGIATSTIGRSNAFSGITLLPDNSIIGIGTVTVLSAGTGIFKYTSSGLPDTNFNGVGYQQISIGSNTQLQALALQSDKKIVVGGYAVLEVTCFALARFDTTGKLDTTFGDNGYITTDIGGGSSINALLIQPDGKILAGGVAGQGTPGFAVARYTTDGSLDKSFGKGGIARINPGYISTINALALQTDGKILAAGFAWNFVSDVCTLTRFNSDGSLDTDFGNNGIVTTAIGAASRAQAIAIQRDGHIVIGGYTTNDMLHYSFALVRYDTKGNLDLTFNETGIVITPVQYSSQIQTLAIQSDNKIIAGGWCFGAQATEFALARYTSSGLLDQTFGDNGITSSVIGNSAQINSLAIQADGNIIAAGVSDNRAVLARYLA